MAGNAVIATASMYMDTLIVAPYLYATTAILSDPKKIDFSTYGLETRVREVIGGTASNYQRGVGFQPGGTGAQVLWTPFTAQWDREFTYQVDAIDELNSILQGMELSGAAAIDATWRNFAAEIDATTFSFLFSKTPTTNVFSASVAGPTKLATDAANIFATLNTIKQKLFNVGVLGPVAVFVDSVVYANISTALINNMALANDKTLTVNAAVSDASIDIKINVKQYQNLYIIPTPDDRMSSVVAVKDGRSVGQEAGGWIPAITDPNYKHLQLVAVPFDAAAVSIRHLVANFTAPARFMGDLQLKMNKEIKSLNGIYRGAASLNHIGIDQQGDWFRYQNRTMYGAMVFESWKQTLFAITA